MIKLEDLMCMDDMYFIGDLIDTDDSGWVTEEEAIELLKIVNEENK